MFISHWELATKWTVKRKTEICDELTVTYRSENLFIRVIVDAISQWKVHGVIFAFTSSNVLSAPHTDSLTTDMTIRHVQSWNMT